MQINLLTIYMGNNPMVGATVAVAVAVEEGMNK
ncbi:GGGtGRT protein [Clostridium cadaveris]|nr:GGGtGRT protein [Clostridium cadaveris]